MMESMNATPDAAGIGERSWALAADAGYWYDQAGVAQVEHDGPELFIATANRWKEAQDRQQKGAAAGQTPPDAPPRQRMTGKVRTNGGRRSTGYAAGRWNRCSARSRASWAALSPPRPGGGPVAMVADLLLIQPPQTVHGSLWIGNEREKDEKERLKPPGASRGRFPDRIKRDIEPAPGAERRPRGALHQTKKSFDWR